jgi:DME family drug/metabolite transporter
VKKNLDASLGAGLVLLSSLFYASYAIWTKLMGDFFGGYMASLYRSTLVCIIFLPLVFIAKKSEPLNLHKNWKFILGALPFSFFIWGPFYYSVIHAGVGLSVAVNYASIVLGMFFFGWLFSGEKFTKNKLVSSLIGLFGLILIFIPSSSANGLNFALFGSLLSGFCIAGFMVLTKKMTYNSMQTTLMSWVISIIANFIMVFVVGESFPEMGWHVEYFYLLLFAVASIASSWPLIRALRLIDAGTAGVIGLLEIVFGLLFGVVLFSEKISFLEILGAAIIVVSALVSYKKDIKKIKGSYEI